MDGGVHVDAERLNRPQVFAHFVEVRAVVAAALELVHVEQRQVHEPLIALEEVHQVLRPDGGAVVEPERGQAQQAREEARFAGGRQRREHGRHNTPRLDAESLAGRVAPLLVLALIEPQEAQPAEHPLELGQVHVAPAANG